MADGELVLLVNGRRYGGWQSVRVTRSIESLAGSFELEASDRWGAQEIPWPIMEEDACRVEIDGVRVIDGYVDDRRLGLGKPLHVTGRDRSAALVDNSALLKKWTFGAVTVADIAKTVAAPFGISVSVQPGIKLPKAQKKQTVSPGEKCWEILHHAASEAGVLIVSDGAGGILITRGSKERISDALVQGENLLDADIEYSAKERFHRYVIVTQSSAAEFLDGIDVPVAVSRVRAEALDLGVRRTDRVMLIRPEKGLTTAYAKQRADWEARVRAAKAETVTAVVLGWQRPGGDLWPLNKLVHFRSARLGIDGDLLISQVEHQLSASGRTTHMRLVRPDAFTPEPRAIVSGVVGYKELRDGVPRPATSTPPPKAKTP